MVIRGFEKRRHVCTKDGDREADRQTRRIEIEKGEKWQQYSFIVCIHSTFMMHAKIQYPIKHLKFLRTHNMHLILCNTKFSSFSLSVAS